MHVWNKNKNKNLNTVYAQNATSTESRKPDTRKSREKKQIGESEKKLHLSKRHI